MTSRREEKDRRRAERLAAEQAASEQAKRRRLYSIVVGGALALAAVAAIVAVAATGGGGDGDGSSGGVPTGNESYEGAATPPPQEETDLFRAARAAGCVLRNPVIEGRTHVPPGQDVEYETNPPTSGNHDPVPAGDGVYDRAPSAQGIKHFVHTLEHGRVEIQYDPTLDERRIDQLGGLFNDDPYHMVLFPNRRMPYAVATTAWGHLLGCREVNDRIFDAIRAFRDRYRNQGPEQVA
ncbi:MAG: DUF3105 domain-containing protein [Solirubrobacterales bacterium]